MRELFTRSARYLSGRGINIESVDSETTLAPVSGSPLFAMKCKRLRPADPWRARARRLGLKRSPIA